MIEIATPRAGGRGGRDGRAAGAARAAAGAAAARHGHVPRHADAARGRPGALDPAGQRRARRRPHARDGRQPRPRGRGARARAALRVRRRRARSRGCSRCPTGRCGSSSRPARACASTGSPPSSPTSSRRSTEAPDVVHEGPELTALVRNVQQTFARIIEDVPYLPEELQMAVANLDDPSALAHLIAGALRIKTEEKQALLEELDVGKRLHRLSELLARELEVAAIGSRIQSQVQSELDRSQREYVLRQQLKAIQEELGERDPTEAEVDELREQLAAIALPEDVRKQADRELARLEKLPQAAAEHGVIRTYLEWLASLPWDTTTEDNLDLGARARGARRRPLRHREGQGADPRVPRRAPPEAGRARLDPLLRRPAGRRQDVARPVDRARARAQVRAHQRRRRARRGRDPRPPPHLHRRDARHDHPRAARRRLGQPAVHDRRDRQDGLGLPRRPGLGDARGARPRAERDLPRPLPRRAVRPLQGDVHHDGEHARHGPGRRCATAWR